MRQQVYTIVMLTILVGVGCPMALPARQARDEIVKLLNQGASLLEAGKPKEALKPLTAAVAKAEQSFGKDHGGTAQALAYLARAHDQLGQYAQAESIYRRALEIRETRLGKDSTSVATSLNDLARLYVRQGEHARPEVMYKRALGIFETRKGKTSAEVASVLNNLAFLYERMGEYARAEQLYKRSLGIRESRSSRDALDVVPVLQNLGSLHLRTGQYAQAESFFRRCLELSEARLAKDHPNVAQALHNLGVLYQTTGQYARAEPLYKRSLAIQETRLGKDHPGVGRSLNNLAALYELMEKEGLAEPLYRRALAIVEARLGKDHLDVATPLNNLARLLVRLEQPDRAEALDLRCLAIREARQGKDHPMVALSLTNLAALYLRTKQYAKAEPLFRRGLRIREGKFSADHPDVASSLNHLAILLEAQGKTSEATSLFDRARRSSRRHVSQVLPSLTPAEQAAYLAVTERGNLRLALAQNLRHPAEPGLAERAASWLLNGKAIAEESLARSALLARDSRDPAAGKLAAELRERRAQLARLSFAVPPEGKEKAHRERLATLTAQEAELARQLAAVGGASAGAATWLNLADVRRALPADAVFLDVARFAAYDFTSPQNKPWRAIRYVAWITAAKGDVRLVDLGEAEKIDDAVKQVRRALEDSVKLIRAKGEAEAEKALREPLEKLSRLVLTPLLPNAGKAKRWIVSPDGNLWLVPWEVLLLPGGKYAIEEHSLSYVVSGRDLLPTSPLKGKPGRPLIVANPDFGLDRKTARAEAERMGTRSSGDELRSVSGHLRLGAIRPLPGTMDEAKAIDKPLTAYTKQATRLLLERYALEGLVKRTANPRVLVLATHGFFLPRQEGKSPDARDGIAPAPGWENPLLRCGLLLAGCNGKATEGDDGVLTGLEVVGMDLRGTELVVLSACETGLGEVQNGEGVAGLRQAFRLAGAEAVVSTLWKVPDKQSAELMTRFFAGLAARKDRTSALRDAQLKVIEGRRDDTASAHPFYWAAFTVTGR